MATLTTEGIVPAESSYFSGFLVDNQVIAGTAPILPADDNLLAYGEIIGATALDGYLINGQTQSGLAPTLSKSDRLLYDGVLPSYAPAATAGTVYFWS